MSWTRGWQGAEKWDAKMLVKATNGVDGSVPQVMEEITEAEKFIPQEQLRNHTLEQTVDPTVPQIPKELVEVI